MDPPEDPGSTVPQEPQVPDSNNRLIAKCVQPAAVPRYNPVLISSLHFEAKSQPLLNMQGLSLQSLKKHKALIPLYACTLLGFGGAMFYLVRLATRSPEVTWNRNANPEPWEAYRNKQYKFYSPTMDYSKEESKAPKY